MCNTLARYENFTAVKIQVEVFRVVTPCTVVVRLDTNVWEVHAASTTIYDVKTQKTSR